MNEAVKHVAEAVTVIDEEQRRRNIRRTTIVLVLVALGIYVAFIASSIYKAGP